MTIKTRKWILGLLSSVLLFAPAGAQDYPPAMVYEQMPDFINLDQNAELYFGRKLLSMHVYVPQRNVETRIDIVDAQGKILSTKERVHKYKNGEAVGEIDTWVTACASGACTDGPNTLQLAPGVYWIVFSEKGKIFSAEWFEVRSFGQGEGRFAKGQKAYTVLPHDNMAKLFFEDGGKGNLRLAFGISAGAEVGEQSAVTKKMSLSLKYNGQPFAKGLGNVPQPENIYAHTTLIESPLLKVQGNAGIKASDLKDGKYELDVNLDGKSVRRYQFEVKGGKIVYQGRQQESTRPPERMVVSEKAYWLWNTYAKEPNHVLPAIDLSAASAPAAAASAQPGQPATPAQPAAQPTPAPTANPVGDVLKQLPKLPF